MVCFSFPLENWRISQLHFGSASFHFLTNPKGFSCGYSAYYYTSLLLFILKGSDWFSIDRTAGKADRRRLQVPCGPNRKHWLWKIPVVRWEESFHRFRHHKFPKLFLGIFVYSMSVFFTDCWLSVFLFACGIPGNLWQGGLTDITSIGLKLSHTSWISILTALNRLLTDGFPKGFTQN